MENNNVCNLSSNFSFINSSIKPSMNYVDDDDYDDDDYDDYYDNDLSLNQSRQSINDTITNSPSLNNDVGELSIQRTISEPIDYTFTYMNNDNYLNDCNILKQNNIPRNYEKYDYYVVDSNIFKQNNVPRNYEKYDYYVIGNDKMRSEDKSKNGIFITIDEEKYINNYIKDKYQKYLDMEYAPNINVECPHCLKNIVLNKHCSKCGWKIGIHFIDKKSCGDIIAYPVLNSQILSGESLIYINKIPYNKDQIVKIKVMKDNSE
jgi:hypothetical protein